MDGVDDRNTLTYAKIRRLRTTGVSQWLQIPNPNMQLIESGGCEITKHNAITSFVNDASDMPRRMVWQTLEEKKKEQRRSNPKDQEDE